MPPRPDDPRAILKLRRRLRRLQVMTALLWLGAAGFGLVVAAALVASALLEVAR